MSAAELARTVGSVGSLQFEISHLWNGDPIPPSPSHKINTEITLKHVTNFLTVSILANFFDDPMPPQVPGETQSYSNLWPYEIVELFFHSTEGQRYLQVLFSPHGQYLVLLSNGTKNHIDSGLPLDFKAVINKADGTWTGEAKIPLDYLPPKVDRFMAAAIHGYDDNRQTETLYPLTGPKPDLHQTASYGEIDLDVLLPGLRQRSALSPVWQKALANPIMTHTIFYMWDGTPIEKDHETHKAQYCTLFFKGIPEGLNINIMCPFFNDPPPAGPPGPTDKLWEHEVAETFFLAALPNGTNRYIELEFGPFGHHIVLLLDGYRNAIAKLLPLQYQAIIDGISNVWVGSAIVPKEYFPPGVNKFIATGVHNTGKTPEEVKYEVNSPMPGPSADFHRLEKYIDIRFDDLVPGNSNSSYSSIWNDAFENPLPPDEKN